MFCFQTALRLKSQVKVLSMSSCPLFVTNISHQNFQNLKKTVNSKFKFFSGRLKIRQVNFLSMKVRANDIDLRVAERFDIFSYVIFNYINLTSVFRVSLVLFSFFLKQQYLILRLSRKFRYQVL